MLTAKCPVSPLSIDRVIATCHVSLLFTRLSVFRQESQSLATLSEMGHHSIMDRKKTYIVYIL